MLGRKPIKTRLYFHSFFPIQSELWRPARCDAFAGEGVRFASGPLQLADILELSKQPQSAYRNRNYCRGKECQFAFGQEKLKAKLNELLCRASSVPDAVQLVRRNVIAALDLSAPVPVASDTPDAFNHDVTKEAMDRPAMEERLWRLVRADMITIDDERVACWLDLLSQFDRKSSSSMSEGAPSEG